MAAARPAPMLLASSKPPFPTFKPVAAAVDVVLVLLALPAFTDLVGVTDPPLAEDRVVDTEVDEGSPAVVTVPSVGSPIVVTVPSVPSIGVGTAVPSTGYPASAQACFVS